LSTLFVFLLIVGIVGSAFDRRPYRRRIPPPPAASTDDYAKPKFWKGPDGKIHILDPDGALDRPAAYPRSRQPAPIGSEVSFEPGKPMVDVSSPSYGSRYR